MQAEPHMAPESKKMYGCWESFAMPTSVARRAQETAASAAASPVVVYVATSLDGTSFALDGASQLRVREAFPSVHVTTRRIFISHDTRDTFNESVGRFEDQIAVLLTGVQANKLVEVFGAISFRDPQTEKELGRLPATKRAARRA